MSVGLCVASCLQCVDVDKWLPVCAVLVCVVFKWLDLKNEKC